MGRPTTSTRGVITSRTVVSRKSCKGGEDEPFLILACFLSASAASRARSWGRSSGEPSRSRNTFTGDRSGAGPAAISAGLSRFGRGQHGHGLERLVVVRPAVDECGRGLAEPNRVQGLHDPALGPRPLGQKDVGSTIEEHEHRHRGEVAVGLLEAELEADGHPSHVPHLEVDDDEVGLVLVDGGGHGVARVDLDDLGIGIPTTATTSARTDGASLATTIVRTVVRLTGVDVVGKTWSATSPSPCTSWTSTSSRGTSDTGDGATWSTRAAKASRSRRFTAW